MVIVCEHVTGAIRIWEIIFPMLPLTTEPLIHPNLFLNLAMLENSIYQKGLLYLLHSVALADGVAHDYEKKALAQIKDHENIPEKLYSEFIKALDRYSEQEIYQKGISLILQCKPQERLRAMAWVYRMIEADNHVDIKEAVWLLNTIRRAAADWSEVNDLSKKLPSFFDS